MRLSPRTPGAVRKDLVAVFIGLRGDSRNPAPNPHACGATPKDSASTNSATWARGRDCSDSPGAFDSLRAKNLKQPGELLMTHRRVRFARGSATARKAGKSSGPRSVDLYQLAGSLPGYRDLHMKVRISTRKFHRDDTGSPQG